MVDAVLVRNKKLYGIAETKCRYDADSIEEFLKKYGTLLVTGAKIDRGCVIADGLQLPFFVILYIPASHQILVKQVYDPVSGKKAFMEPKTTTTQKNVNGGFKVGENYFIDLSGAPVFVAIEGVDWFPEK